MKPSHRDGFIFCNFILNKNGRAVNNIPMDITMANMEDNEVYLKVPDGIEVRPIEDKIFEDGIKEILSVKYD
jgi:hypothetical protein